MSITFFNYPRMLIHHWKPEWQTAMDTYLNTLWSKSQSMNTVDNFATVLTHFFSCPTGTRQRQPWTYSRADVEAFLAHPGPRGTPVKPSTRNVRLAVVSSFFRFVSGYTVQGRDGTPVPLFNQASPTAGIKYAKEPKVFRQFSDDELRRFFAALPDRGTPLGALYFAIFQFYFFSCRRREELLRLQWQDITAVIFADGRTGFTYSWTGKGDAGQRHTSELPVHVYESIVHYLHVSGRWDTLQSGSYLFVGTGPESGGRAINDHLRGESVWLRLKKTCEQAGLDPARFCIHSFRHTGSRIRYSLSHDPVQVMQHLGHRSLQTTYVYLQTLSGQEDKQAADVYARYRDL